MGTNPDYLIRESEFDMADLSNNNGGGDAIDTSIDGIRKAVEGAGAPDEGDNEDDDDGEDDDDADDDDSSGDDDGKGGDSGDSDDDTDDGDDSEDEEDDENPDDKKDPKSGRKYSQFAGDGTDKAYIGNLEEGYKKSSAEAIRIKGDLDQAQGRLDSLLRVVADNPELSKQLNEALAKSGGAGKSGGDDGGSNDDSNSSDPFVRNLQAEWQEKSEKEIQEFIDANPEVDSDPKIKADVQHYMKLFSNDYHQRTGKLMSGGEAMAAAYKHLGLEDKRGKQELAAGAKKNLTPPRSRGNKAKKSGGQKPAFTADQIAMAKAMGKDEAWLQNNAK